MATVPASTPSWRREEAAPFGSLGVGAGAVVVEGLPVPTSPVRVESATKLAATPVAFLQSLFGVVVPATKLTAAHFGPRLASVVRCHCATKGKAGWDGGAGVSGRSLGEDRPHHLGHDVQSGSNEKERATNLVQQTIGRVANDSDDTLLAHPLLGRRDHDLAVVSDAGLLNKGVDLCPVAGGLVLERGAEQPVALRVTVLDREKVAVDVEIVGRRLGEIGEKGSAGPVALLLVVERRAFEGWRVQQNKVCAGGREERERRRDDGGKGGHCVFVELENRRSRGNRLGGIDNFVVLLVVVMMGNFFWAPGEGELVEEQPHPDPRNDQPGEQSMACREQAPRPFGTPAGVLWVRGREANGRLGGQRGSPKSGWNPTVMVAITGQLPLSLFSSPLSSPFEILLGSWSPGKPASSWHQHDALFQCCRDGRQVFCELVSHPKNSSQTCSEVWISCWGENRRGLFAKTLVQPWSPRSSPRR